MADISAAMVMELRKMSGQGMMDCKKALQEADGDVEQAMDLLRKKGLATLAKRAGRATSEGLVVNKSGDDGKTAVLATLCCETDFVAKSDAFVATAQSLADFALACTAGEGAENILELAPTITGHDLGADSPETRSHNHCPTWNLQSLFLLIKADSIGLAGHGTEATGLVVQAQASLGVDMV